MGACPTITIEPQTVQKSPARNRACREMPSPLPKLHACAVSPDRDFISVTLDTPREQRQHVVRDESRQRCVGTEFLASQQLRQDLPVRPNILETATPGTGSKEVFQRAVARTADSEGIGGGHDFEEQLLPIALHDTIVILPKETTQHP